MTDTTTYDALVDAIAEQWNVDTDAVRAYHEAYGGNIDTLADERTHFEDAFLGEQTLMDYAEEIVENHNLDEWVLRYFDYDALIHDLEMEGYREIGNYLFRPC